MTVAEFSAAVVEYRRRTGGSVTSWGRTPNHNVQVGGVSNSPHIYDMGVDLIYDPGSNVGRDQLADSLGLRIIHEPDHDHLQPKDWLPLPP